MTCYGSKPHGGWLRAPRLTLSCKGFASRGYDRAERAYVLTRTGGGEPSALKFTLEATPASPIVNPALVVHDWGGAAAAIKIDGKAALPGRDFRFGHRRRLEGTDLIVWTAADRAGPMRIELVPAEGESPP